MDKKQKDVKKYYVKFYANEKQNIDPSANMYIRLFGDFNQSSDQKLRKSQTHNEIFVNDQVNASYILCHILVYLTKLNDL